MHPNPSALKFALYPGWITSKTDGDRHFISARQLAMCYGVKMSECFIVPSGTDAPEFGLSREGREKFIDDRGLVRLYPLYCGGYEMKLKQLLDENK